MLGVECMHLHETIHTTIERSAGLVDREKCVDGLDRNNATDKTDRTEDVDLTKKTIKMRVLMRPSRLNIPMIRQLSRPNRPK